MAKESKLSATLPDGTVATRRTARSYTHVLAVQLENGSWVANNWCGRYDLAVKAQQQLLHGKYGRPSLVTQLVEVNDPSKLQAPAPVAPVALVSPDDSNNHLAWNEQRLRDELQRLKPGYQAYVAAQVAKDEATKDQLRPQYRAYRKAAAQLRAMKKGAAPAAPATPVTGVLHPGHGGRDITEALERSQPSPGGVWHYGMDRQHWGSVSATGLGHARKLVRTRHHLTHTRGMWFQYRTPKQGTTPVYDFKGWQPAASSEGPQGLKDMLRLG